MRAKEVCPASSEVLPNIASKSRFINSIPLGVATAVVALSLLSSCSREKFSLADLEYVTVECVQGPPQHRHYAPDFYFDLPKGFRSWGVPLREDDVVYLRASGHAPDLEDRLEFGFGGLDWPEKQVTLAVYTQAIDYLPEGDDSERKPTFGERALTEPERLVGYPIITKRTVVFDDYTGVAIYSAIDDETRRKIYRSLKTMPLPRDYREMFECCSGLSAESLILAASNGTHSMVIIADVYGMNNYFPEIMDIVIRIAESIRIQEHVD